MNAASPGVPIAQHRRWPFVELLKIEALLTLREPFALLAGIALPIVLLAIFGWIGQQNPGVVASSGQTIIDLWTPTILVLSFLFIALALPRTMVRDREIGWLRRVSTTPVHPWRLLAAQVVFNLILAAVAILLIIPGGAFIFGASLHVAILPFAISLLLAIAEIFALGLVLVAVMPSQTVSQIASGAVGLPLMFLSGLWVNPAQVGEPLRTIMYYSPSGAPAKALLDSVFNGGPSFPALLTMMIYTVIFAVIAVRYFRWE